MALAGDVASLIVALRLDDKGFTGKLNAATAQLGRMDKGLGQMGRGAGQVAGGLARIGAVAATAAAGGLAAAVTTAASFEQAFTGVEKTVDATEEQFAELEKTIRAMARTGLGTFEDLAGIGEAGGALGIARESLDEFIDVVARLAVSTDLSSEAAATSLGQLSNVLHLGEDDLEDFADTLVALGNAGASTESQIVEMAARFGAAGNAAGLSKEEILALSSAVASMGIEVEAGGSSLSRLFNNVTTQIGTGSKKAEAFAEALGLSFDQFTKAWDTDALGTFEDLLAHLNTLDKFEAAALLRDIGITNVRDINAIKLMGQNVAFVSDQLKIAKDATGALDIESNKFLTTTAGQWFTLKQSVRDAAAVIGTELLPIVNEGISDFVDLLDQPGTQAGLQDFAKDLAVGVRGLATELRGIDWGPIVGGLQAAGTVAKGVLDLFKSLPAPLQGILVGGFALNKLSGGLLGKGVGNIFGGALKTINAGHVTVIGKGVTGGGVPGAGGGGFVGSLGKGLKVGGALASPLAVAGAVIAVKNFEDMRQEATGFLEGKLDALDRSTIDAASASIAKIQAQIDLDRPFHEALLFNTNVKPVLEAELRQLQERVEIVNKNTAAGAASALRMVTASQISNQRLATINANAATNASASLRMVTTGQISNQRLAEIRSKNWSPRISVNNTIHTNVNVAAGTVVKQTQSYMNTVNPYFLD